MLPVNIELRILIVFTERPSAVSRPQFGRAVFHQALSPGGNPLRQA
jgi:hypothetical protein